MTPTTRFRHRPATGGRWGVTAQTRQWDCSGTAAAQRRPARPAEAGTGPSPTLPKRCGDKCPALPAVLGVAPPSPTHQAAPDTHTAPRAISKLRPGRLSPGRSMPGKPMGAMTLGAGPNTPACRPLPTGRAVPQPTARVYLAGRGCCAGTWGGLGRAPRRARPRESWAHVQGEFPGGRLGGQWRRTTVEKYPWEARKRRSGRSLWAGEPGVHGPAPAGRLLTPVRASRPSSNGPSPWGRPVSTHSQGCLSLCSRSLSPAPHCGTCPPPPVGPALGVL